MDEKSLTSWNSQVLTSVIKLEKDDIEYNYESDISNQTSPVKLEYTENTIKMEDFPLLFHETGKQDVDEQIKLKIESEEKNYTCMVCEKIFASQSGLYKHRRTHRRQRTFICVTCGQPFRQKCSLDRHLKIHAGILPYSCEVCKQSFGYKWDLTSHQRQHSGKKTFSCDICRETFEWKFDLDTHLLGHPNVGLEVKRFSCDTCPKSFPKLSSLQIHSRIHCKTEPDESAVDTIKILKTRRIYKKVTVFTEQLENSTTSSTAAFPRDYSAFSADSGVTIIKSGVPRGFKTE